MTRQRGSAIVLVIVMLVLVTVLGAAYLQLARVDREATRISVTSSIDQVINGVVVKLQDILREQVMDNATGKILDPSNSKLRAYDYPETNPNATHSVTLLSGTATATGGTGDQMWLSDLLPQFQPQGTYTDTTYPRWGHLTSLGVRLDIPTNLNANPKWPKEVPLNGNNPANPAAEGSNEWTVNVPLKFLQQTQGDSDYTTTSHWFPRGVDASGCGVEDAVWTWAPTKTLGGLEWAMAIRIVDNSALLNLNLGTGLTQDGNDSVGGDPRGYYPCDVDLGRLLFRARYNGQNLSDGNTWQTELLALLRQRGLQAGNMSHLSNLGLAMPPVTSDLPFYVSQAGTRADAWHLLGRHWGYPDNANGAYTYRAVGPGEEIDLRQRWDLVGRASGTLPIGRAMPSALRGGKATGLTSGQSEGHFAQVDDVWPSGVMPTTGFNWNDYSLAVRNYYCGYPATGGKGQADKLTDPIASRLLSARKFPAVRHFLTARSGSSIWAGNPGGIYNKGQTGNNDTWIDDNATGVTRMLKFDLNRHRLIVNSADPADTDPYADKHQQKHLYDLQERLKRILKMGKDAAPNKECYLWAEVENDFIQSYGAGTLDDYYEELAWEYALNIVDYGDRDIRPTARALTKTYGGKTYNMILCGMETLPYLRQVYIEQAYQDTDPNAPATPDPANPLPFNCTLYKKLPGKQTQSVAIEIGNPFDQTLKFKATAGERPDQVLQGNVRIVIWQPGKDENGASSWEFSSAPAVIQDLPDTLKPGEHLIIVSDANPADRPNKEWVLDPADPAKFTTVNRPALSTSLKSAAGAKVATLKANDVLKFDVDAAVNNDSKDVVVELQVKAKVRNDAGGVSDAWVTYDRLTWHPGNGQPGFYLPETIDHSGDPVVQPLAGTPPKPDPTWKLDEMIVFGQVILRRDCTKPGGTRPSLRFLSNAGKGAAAGNTNGDKNFAHRRDLSRPTDPANKYIEGEANTKFGLDNKGVNGNGNLDGLQICIANRQFLSVHELGMVPMVGIRQVKVGSAIEPVGDFPQRLDGSGDSAYDTAHPLHKRVDPRRRTLDFSEYAPVVKEQNGDTIGLPHAAILFDQFTTLSPRYDREDNNYDPPNPSTNKPPKDDTDETEQFVPGTINLNTAPNLVKLLGLPLPMDGSTDAYRRLQQYWEMVERYRDLRKLKADGSGWDALDRKNLVSFPAVADQAKARTGKGIARLSELLYLKPIDEAGAAQTHLDIQRNYAAAKYNDADLYPTPEDETADPERGTAKYPIGTVTDPESHDTQDRFLPKDRLAMYQYLCQIATTRSDVFTAFVVVRGYQAGNWGMGPVESARFVVVLDRSNLTKTGDTPKIVGFMRLE